MIVTDTDKDVAAYGRAQRGAQWLDENFPGWESRINIDTLYLDDANRCICGQIFEEQARGRSDDGFSYAVDHLFAQANSWISVLLRKGDDGTQDRATRVSCLLGFERGYARDGTPEGDIYLYYAHLQEAWVRLLSERGLERD